MCDSVSVCAGAHTTYIHTYTFNILYCYTVYLGVRWDLFKLSGVPRQKKGSGDLRGHGGAVTAVGSTACAAHLTQM